jgi:hypothetical protein
MPETEATVDLNFLGVMLQRHGDQLDQLIARGRMTEARLTAVEARLTAVEQRQTTTDGLITALIEAFNGFQQHLDRRLDRIEHAVGLKDVAPPS